MDLEEAADRLYALAPDDFTAERESLAKAAKQAGDASLAKEIGRLRKPTVAAWAVNHAARAAPGAFTELADLGARLRAAWADQDPAALAELTRARGPLTARLARLVREHAERAGRPLTGSAATEMEQTLDAATVDEGAAQEVRRGRLTRPLSYTGFTPAPAAAPKAKTATKRPAEKRSGGEREDRRRKELEQALAEAERAAEEAERGHAEWAGELAEATAEHDRAAARVESLTRQLAEARQNLTAAEHRRDVAARDEERARHAATTARHKAAQAAHALQD
ncbi:hypothetical protein [Spongiactinospora rosea]|nr:hypothetical protein [Spongiactinospora rosea]